MAWLHVCFWLSAACAVYAYGLYPLAMWAAARLRTRPRRCEPLDAAVSVVVAAHNEERSIGRRLRELTQLVTTCGGSGEVIVVSDGSTDRTAAIVSQFTDGPVRLLELPRNAGKAAALTAGCAAARHEILVFADARQSWAPDALRLLLENFSDPGVGAVSGDLVAESTPGVMAGVGLYWRYEKWLRRLEGRVNSTVGVTGAISAVRRPLFRGIPAGTILDDVYWPLQVAMQGYRVVHDSRARAYDRLPDRPCDEFRRKVRTQSGNFQLLARLPGALLPWRNPIWFQFLSHKVLRLLVPWALLGMLCSSALLSGALYHAALAGQVLFYLLALAGIWGEGRLRLRPASAASSFVVLNTAAWLGFWVWVSGRAGKSWRKVAYRTAPSIQAEVWQAAQGVPNVEGTVG
jgi:cellulose synthase/poly-beta-1,6-N-acetylglucosamine synthase-like glycosyltransferase